MLRRKDVQRGKIGRSDVRVKSTLISRNKSKLIAAAADVRMMLTTKNSEKRSTKDSDPRVAREVCPSVPAVTGDGDGRGGPVHPLIPSVSIYYRPIS